MIHECVIRKQKVFIIYSDEMVIQRTKVYSYYQVIGPKQEYSSGIVEFYDQTTTTQLLLNSLKMG